MTFRTHTLLAALGRFVRYLTLALLPALTAEASQDGLSNRDPVTRPIPETYPQSPDPASQPYLAVVGSPPLRFRPPPAPPDFEIEPIATGPSRPDDEIPVAPALPQARLDQAVNLAPSPKTVIPAAAPKRADDKEPLPILPDDTRHDVHPEDILPFFQFPRGGVGTGIPVPAQPAAPALPPSSATYRQQ